ncbi:MAG TPA: methyltransferase [Patescibacteria group bacterium]|nr:methyltransferase [Patescibacteria group bacterium]
MKLPELDVGYGELYKTIFTPVRCKLMLTGIELKVFNYLSEPVSAEEVAQTLDAHIGNMAVFLDGLTSVDLVRKEDGLYQNMPIAESFLVEGSQTYVGHMFTWMAAFDAPLDDMAKLVKEGPPPKQEAPPFSEEMLTRGVSMMVNTELAGDAQLAVKIVSNLPEFPSFKKMLDLGCGPGLIGMSIVDAHPDMKGVVFDLPPVVAVAEKYIKEFQMEGRVETLGGDFNQSPVGGGYDLVYTSNALQFAQDIDTVVKKVYDALNLGGVFVSVFGFGLTNEGTKPENLVLGSLSTALMGQGFGVEVGYIADSMLRVGFKSVRSRTLSTAWGPMELDMGRK